MATTRRPNAFVRLFRGETSFDFAGRWRRWFAISGAVIVVGLVSLGVRGLNFSIDFKGGTVWSVPTSATVAEARAAISAAAPGMGQATVQTLTNTLTHQRSIQVKAGGSLTANASEVARVTDALAKLAHVSVNDVQENDIGPSWGSQITDKAVEAVIIFLVVVSIYIWLRFEAKMAVAALAALVHDLLVTAGIYSLSGFQVSPDTVIAFLTILGYSLYDTIVVFDRVQENTRGLASSNRFTYSDTVNLSMNQVLARSLNTSLVAILPIGSILVIGAWILGATALENFGLALLIGLTTGAYSSIFIASPLLALLKEREPRYAEIRRRLTQGPRRRLTPAAAAGGELLDDRPVPAGAVAASPAGRRPAPGEWSEPGEESAWAVADPGAPAGEVAGEEDRPPRPSPEPLGAIPLRGGVPPRANRPPPRPRKKGRR
jgi:preprotein translocase subunit SecF